ncbi:MAG TPA: type II CAAX endopeptidase family protein [Rhizomicrobium sp.]|jgi:membrane protease YdiL (CAAX protease family)
MISYLELAARGKNDWWRYALATVLGCIATIVIFAAVFVLLSLAHVLPSDFTTQMQQPTEPIVFFGAAALSFGSLLAGFALAIKLFHRKRLRDVIGNWNWNLFLRGACIWVAVLCVGLLIDFLLAPHSFTFAADAQTALLAICALAGLSIQTFCEEFVFRGYVTQGMLLATKRPLFAALLSGLIFGALHIWNGVPQAVGALFFGIVCSLIAIRTGTIAFTWGLHFANNYIGAVVVVSAADIFKTSPGILIQNAPQLLWWDVAFSVAGLAVVLLLVESRSGPSFRFLYGALEREA